VVGSAAASVTAVSGVDSVTGAASVAAAVSTAGAAELSSLGASVVASLLEPANLAKLPEIRRVQPLGRLESSPETAPSSSDVTASVCLACPTIDKR